MSQSIELSELQWSKLRTKLSQDYPRSVVMVRWKMKEVLGFVDRTHEEWVNSNLGWPDKWLRTTIQLDFYNEPKRTMFLMKYSEFLNDNSKHNRK